MMANNLSGARTWVAPLFVALALLGASFAPATAQELGPEQLTLAKKFIELTDKGNVYQATLLETAVNTLKTLATQNPKIEKEITATIGKAIEQYKDKKDELLDQIARVYATQFTIDELTQIVAFYETPVGLKLAAANGDISQGISAVVQVYKNNLGKEFFAKVRADLKEQGFNV